MRPLPPPIHSVRIPESFSPSQIAAAGECLMRAALGSSRESPVLHSSPGAELGKVFHRLMELAAQGRIDRDGSAREVVGAALDRLLRDATIRLMKDPTSAAYADLSRTVSRLEWRRKRSSVIEIAARLLALASRPHVVGERNRAPLSYEHLPETGQWAEVRIIAPTLRLAGRMDIVEKKPGLATIRDLKSGRVQDREGQILTHIELQLRIYGVMALEHNPADRLRLVVDSGTEHELAFDRSVQTDTRAWILQRIRDLPRESWIHDRELAKTGVWCATCPYRHTCSTYLESAPATWMQGATERGPLDTWGRVTDIKQRSRALVDLTVNDAAGRRVRIFGVEAGRVADTRLGDQIWLFGLRARSIRDPGGKWRHPVNFYETSDDEPRERAWSLEIFGETEGRPEAGCRPPVARHG